jgi:predicted RNase H-like nuclease (RuvC/YqgF family)
MARLARTLALTLTAAVAWPLPPATGQSLAEIAAKEKKRRTGHAAKTYSNRDLENLSQSPSPSPAEAEEKKTEAEPAPTGTANADEATWRARARSLREDVEQAEHRKADLQAELDTLSADIQPNPADLRDPSRLQKREAAKAELRQKIEDAQKALELAKKAVADLEEEARRQRVPPGWLRE